MNMAAKAATVNGRGSTQTVIMLLKDEGREGKFVVTFYKSEKLEK